MNIFILDFNPVTAAEYYCDQHLSSQPKELVQMLSTNIHVWHKQHPDTKTPGHYANTPTGIYKPTHENHPCTVWMRESVGNLNWLLAHTLALFTEFHYRRNKHHGSQQVFINCLTWMQANGKPAPNAYGTPHAQAMPDQYKATNAVDAYRAYYRAEKSVLKGKPVTYTRRDTPVFMRTLPHGSQAA